MKAKQTLPLKEAWIICFILGVVMLNFPFLHIFNKASLVLGIPLFVLYLMIGWPVSIFVIYLFSIYLGHQPTTSDNGLDNSKEPTDGGNEP